MKVKAASLKQMEVNKGQSSSKLLGSEVKEGSFAEKIHEQEVAKRQEVCGELLKKIDSQSEFLKKGLTPSGLKRYRELVSAFMKEAITKSYLVEEATHYNRYGWAKNDLLVKKINQNLDEIMEQLVRREQSTIELVARLDEIRGWLLDLVI